MNRFRDRGVERRREERVAGGALRARVRPGYRLVIVDLSCEGTLVEAGRPLRPGSQVELQLETDARRAMVAARVMRCTVAAIDSESGVTYRAALWFSESCEWVRETLAPAGYGIPASVERLPRAE
jgi:PilZ domain-containing protein